jgi:hypothetical protein
MDYKAITPKQITTLQGNYTMDELILKDYVQIFKASSFLRYNLTFTQ